MLLIIVAIVFYSLGQSSERELAQSAHVAYINAAGEFHYGCMCTGLLPEKDIK
jgi:hypothetical protein